MKRTKKLDLRLPVQYTAEEMNAKRDRIANAMLEYDGVEDAKKLAARQYSEHLKGLRGEMRGLAKAINNGGENREVECLTTFHDPEPGFKTITRLDTGEVVRQEPMDDEEKQDNLFDQKDDIEYLTKLYEGGSSEAAQPSEAMPPHERRGESPGAVPLPPPQLDSGGDAAAPGGV